MLWHVSIFSDLQCQETLPFLISFIPFAFPLDAHILFISFSHYPVTFPLSNLFFFGHHWLFSIPSLFSFCLFLLILLLFFYFCHHMVSQLSLSFTSLPPTYTPLSIPVFAMIFVLEIKLTYLPVILEYAHAH